MHVFLENMKFSYEMRFCKIRTRIKDELFVLLRTVRTVQYSTSSYWDYIRFLFPHDLFQMVPSYLKVYSTQFIVAATFPLAGSYRFLSTFSICRVHDEHFT